MAREAVFRELPPAESGVAGAAVGQDIVGDAFVYFAIANVPLK